MEQLDQIAAQFYAVPFIAKIFDSHGILRLAVLQYGTPLFLVLCALLFLILILVVAKLMPKKGRPKKVRERKEKPAKAEKKPRASRKSKTSAAPRKARGTPKSVLKNLAKIPDTTLPLYPVADKRKPLAIDDMAIDNGMMPNAVVAPVIDDNSLIAGLDMPDPASQSASQPVASAPVQSFTLDNLTAAQIMADTAPSSSQEDEFDIPAINPSIDMAADADIAPRIDIASDDMAIDADEDGFEDDETEFDIPVSTDSFASTGDDPADDHSFDLSEDVSDDEDGYDFEEDDHAEEDDFGPSMDMDESPKHEVTVDVSPIGGDDFDMPVGSFGSDGDASADGLSEEAQQKLAELNNQGMT